MLVRILLFACILAFSSACKSVKPTIAQKDISKAKVLPSRQQIAWQKMEYYMFIHFGPNTFTDMEWGHGDEDPDVFNPESLDAEQWVRIAKQAGMKGIIITAKHHDGFCLWPSQYSTHTVRESEWKNGKGDVLKELAAACRKHDMKMGVYLSPWDRNHPSYGTPEYNQVFANMLTEVLGNYGDIFEVWFDGANGEGPNGKKQVYDWTLFNGTVRKLQPNAVIFSDVGPGCRWIGNERGFAGETNWSTINTAGYEPGLKAPARKSLNEGEVDGANWVPGEADVSIRPGWFYSPSTNDSVKSLAHLLDIYYASVGRNANLLLNVPVDRQGLIHSADSARLMELRKRLDQTFDNNKALGAKVSSEGEKRSLKNLTDGNFESYWSPGSSATQGSVVIELDQPASFNRIALQEYIPFGQRVKSFRIDVWDEAKQEFREIAEQSTIGYKRLLRFPSVETSKVRLTIAEAKPGFILSEVGLYQAPE